MKFVDILGFETSASGLEGDVNCALGMLESGVKGKYVACANPHSVVVAQSDSHFKRALAKADILLPDGVGIVLAAKILGLDLTERVTGPDFF